MAERIGPTFSEELVSAGLSGLPFGWDDKGNFYGYDELSQEQQQGITAVLAGHNPNALTVVQQRTNTFKADPARVDMIDRLRNATPAQIDTYIDNNVTNLAQARTFLKALTKVLAIVVRD